MLFYKSQCLYCVYTMFQAVTAATFQTTVSKTCNTIDKILVFQLFKFIGEYTCTRLLVSARVLGREYVRSNE